MVITGKKAGFAKPSYGGSNPPAASLYFSSGSLYHSFFQRVRDRTRQYLLPVKQGHSPPSTPWSPQLIYLKLVTGLEAESDWRQHRHHPPETRLKYRTGPSKNVVLEHQASSSWTIRVFMATWSVCFWNMPTLTMSLSLIWSNAYRNAPRIVASDLHFRAAA